MSIFDFFTTNQDEKTADERLAERLLGTYYRYRLMSDVGEKALGMLGPEGESDKLTRENQELDINVKRKALGLPLDDDLYQKATNDNLPFRTKGVIAAFGKHTSDLIPSGPFPGVQPLSSGESGAKMIGELEKLGRSLKYSTSMGVTADAGVQPFRSAFRNIFRR